LIPFGVATQERDTHAFFEEYVFAVAKPIAEFDLMALEVVKIFEALRPVGEYREECKIAVVHEWRDEGKRDKQLRHVSAISR
jgi:hypothetical protein